MNIDIICTGLLEFAQSLKQEASLQIKSILPKTEGIPGSALRDRQQNHVSHPERPWMVSGVAALAIGAVGAILTNGSWPYIVGGGGIAAILYGQTKKKPRDSRVKAEPSQDANNVRGYEVAEKVIELSGKIEEKWRIKVEECKRMVQQAIESSSASSDIKDSALSQTYTTERISIDFDSTVSRLDSEPTSAYPSILAEYERIIFSKIDEAASAQIAIYQKISQIL